MAKGMKEFEAEYKPWRIVRFAVLHPWKFLFILVVCCLGISAAGLSKFTLNDLDGWDVRQSASSKSFTAYEKGLDIIGRNITAAGLGGASSGALETTQPLRSIPLEESSLFVFFRTSKTGGTNNIFTAKNLAYMATIEKQITARFGELEGCLLLNDNTTTCAPPFSITMLTNQETVPENIDMNAFKTALLSNIGRFDLLLSNDASLTESNFTVSVVRSIFSPGVPLKGYANSLDRDDEQENEIMRIYGKLHDDYLNSLHKESIENIEKNGVEVIHFWVEVNNYLLNTALTFDAAFAGGSFVFVGLYMGFHTRSASIAGAGMFQIFMGFPVTYFIYRFIFGIAHFGTLQILAIYVILGIGADDIFVIVDTFRQADVYLPIGTSLLVRLDWAYRRSFAAISITSITTFVVFVITAISPILNIQVFGIFASMLVATNFLLTILYTPVMIVISERYGCCGCFKCCPKACKPKQSFAREDKTNDSAAAADAAAIVVNLASEEEAVPNSKESHLVVIPPSLIKSQLAAMHERAENIPQTSGEVLNEIEVLGKKFLNDEITKEEFLAKKKELLELDSKIIEKNNAIHKAQELFQEQQQLDTPKKIEATKPGKDESTSAEAEDIIFNDENLTASSRWFKYKYAPFLIRFRIPIFVFNLGVIAFFTFYAAQMEPSSKDIGQIWPDDHFASKAMILSSNDFLKGDAEFIGFTIGFGVLPMDRSKIQGFNPNDVGEFSFTPNFDASTVSSQRALLQFCVNVRAQSFIHKLNCWTDDFQEYLGNFTSLSMPIENQTEFKTALSDWLRNTTEDDSEVLISTVTGLPAMISYRVLIETKPTADLFVRLEKRNELENFLRAYTTKFYESEFKNLGEPVLSDFLSPFMDTSAALVSSAIQGMIYGTALGVLVMALAARSWRIGLITGIAVAEIVACVLGTMVLIGYKLGFMESISSTVLVGLSVDYSVHLLLSYRECKSGTLNSKERTIRSLTLMGTSVLAGAITTFGAGFFLLFCSINYLQQFGAFLVMVIAYSIFVSLTMVPCLLTFIGPSTFIFKE